MRSSEAKGRLAKISMRRRSPAWSSFSKVARSAVLPANFAGSGSGQEEVIVVAPCGFDLARSMAEAETLRQLPRWSEIAAVKQGRVWAVDGNAYFNRSGPRIVDSLEILAHILHPDRFPPPSSGALPVR